jgi:hypothetical protein
MYAANSCELKSLILIQVVSTHVSPAGNLFYWMYVFSGDERMKIFLLKVQLFPLKQAGRAQRRWEKAKVSDTFLQGKEREWNEQDSESRPYCIDRQFAFSVKSLNCQWSM